MNPREFSHRWLPFVVATLDRLNQRYPWSHNDHFHDWILRHLPVRRRSALDVGCGHGGLLVALSKCFDHAHGTELDKEVRGAARRTIAALPGASVDARHLVEMEGSYDLITMVAVLHHLDTEAALAQCRRLLAPGGRLMVVGLARPDTTIDWLWDVFCLLSNPVIGLIKHPRRAAVSVEGPGFPVVDPTETYAQLCRSFNELMPGARLSRRLGFRYTAMWTKPH